VRRLFKKIGRTKLLAFIGIAAVLGVFLFVMLSGGGSKTLHERAMANIAEARFYMMQAQTEDLRVQFFSGIREQNYQMDGVADTSTVPFALINVEPRGINLIDIQEITGTIQIGDAEPVEITLERNQFGRNFGYDLGKLVEAGTEIVFTFDEHPFELAQAMPTDAITWEKALGIGVEHFKSELTAEGVASFESYVKIITDRESLAAFWFVQFVTNTGNNHFIVINIDGQLIQGRQ